MTQLTPAEALENVAHFLMALDYDVEEDAEGDLRSVVDFGFTGGRTCFFNQEEDAFVVCVAVSELQTRRARKLVPKLRRLSGDCCFLDQDGILWWATRIPCSLAENTENLKDAFQLVDEEVLLVETAIMRSERSGKRLSDLRLKSLSLEWGQG